MKLRSRNKRAAINIKQEKPADGITSDTEMSFSKSNTDQSLLLFLKEERLSDDNDQAQANRESKRGSNSVIKIAADADIKQEDTDRHNTLLKEKSDKLSISHINDYYYHCYACRQKLANLRSVLEHFRLIHNIATKTRTIKHLDLEPDVYDPTNYCRACEITYACKDNYKAHLATIHHLYMAPTIKKTKPRQDIKPDPHDADFYCCSCETKYGDRFLYRRHLRKTHRMKLEPMYYPKNNPNDLPDESSPELYCAPCNVTYLSKNGFKIHCRTIHTLINKSLQSKTPDPKDPHLHCKVCNMTYPTKQKYKKHCLNVHNVRAPRYFANPDLLPNISDSKNYCRTCDKAYSVKTTYMTHLNRIHNMHFATLTADANNSPHESHCRVCSQSEQSKRSCLHHLKATKTHRSTLKAPLKRFANPDAIIDTCSKELYCAKCDKRLATKYSFKTHLKRVHSLVRTFANPNATIDIESSTYYCRMCDKHLSCKGSYNYHLVHIHNLML